MSCLAGLKYVDGGLGHGDRSFTQMQVATTDSSIR